MRGIEGNLLHEAMKAATEDLFSALGSSRFERRTGYSFLVSARVPLPMLNGIWAEGPDIEDAVPMLRAAIEDVECFALPFGLLVRAGQTPVLAAEARRSGLSQETRLPALAATPDELQVPELHELAIETVDDAAGRAAAAAVAATGLGWSLTSLGALYSASVVDRPGVRLFLGRVEGHAVATALSVRQDSSVGVFRVATDPRLQDTGVAETMVAWAAADGFAEGAEVAWHRAVPTGPLLERGLGFHRVDDYVLFTRPGPRWA